MSRPTPLAAPSAGVACLFPGWIPDDEAVLTHLAATIAWEQPMVTVFGRHHLAPRLSAWFGDAPYAYSGTTHQPQPWPEPLAAIRARLAAELATPFNSCLANLYRDGRDSMGRHADDEPELGRDPVIASVSLGDRRRFVMTPVHGGERLEWPLGRGDLLVMTGASQRAYRHGVPKTGRTVGRRLNLTFRNFVARAGT